MLSFIACSHLCHISSLLRAESTKIFVGGLSPDVGDKEFKECFEKFGGITVGVGEGARGSGAGGCL